VEADSSNFLQQLNDMLQVLFPCESDVIEAQIQRRYIEEGEYDLCIDEGMQVTPLTRHKWASIEAGMKILMSVTIRQYTNLLSDVDYKCRFCSAVNHLGVRSVKYQSQGGLFARLNGEHVCFPSLNGA
jgi:hypothetical protein